MLVGNSTITGRNNMSDIKSYTKEIEDLFLQFFVTDAELFVRCLGILDDKHFRDLTNKKAVKFMKEHANQYATLPTLEQIKAVSGKAVEKLKDCNDNHTEWFLVEYELFARHREMEEIIYAAPDMLSDGRYGEVSDLLKEAVSIGLVKDLGIDYFKDPKGRLEQLRDNSGTISTGYKSIDEKLYGGINRGEITIFAGQSGSGKSLFLQNFAVNWAEMGLNVVYLSLELSEKLCSMRIDAMHTGYATREIMKNIDDVDLKVHTSQKKNKGTLRIKQLKNGCTSNDIKAYIKEYEIQTGIKVDAILLDYLDLCMPTNIKVSPSDLFVKDKYVSENLRDMAVDLDCLLVTASQLNRQSHDTMEFDHSHISGGISKINSADNVIAIFTTSTMKENGRYQIQFMKTRSSAGVGSKVDLAFNNRSLRISDLAADEAGSVHTQTASVLDSLKRSSSGIPRKTESKPALDDVRDLQSMLKNLNR